MARKKRPTTPAPARPVDEYRHKTATGPRVPEAGAQPYLKGQPPAAKYRYDSSLAPALEWDERNPAREEAEALIRAVLDAPDLAAAKAAAAKLKAMSAPFLNWAGKVLFEWVAEGRGPSGVPPLKITGFRNNGTINTIRVDTKVVHETDTGGAKSDEMQWMRFTLDTVGRRAWPTAPDGRAIYPEGFEELAKKLGRPPHPPGRDVRCIVSVGMLTEGWDCQTVTHVVGLRPFQSPLLCEQVVGRGLRRESYDVVEGDKFDEEVAKVLGVPFDLVPLKATGGPPKPQPPRHHVKAVPAKAGYEIRFPRVEGYTQAVRNRATVDWDALPPLVIDPMRIPPEVEVTHHRATPRKSRSTKRTASPARRPT